MILEMKTTIPNFFDEGKFMTMISGNTGNIELKLSVLYLEQIIFLRFLRNCYQNNFISSVKLNSKIF